MTPHLSEPLWRMGAEPAVGAEPAGAQQVPPPPPPAGPPPVRRLLLERSPRAPREFPPTGAEPDAEPVAANTQDAGEPAIEGAEEPMAEAEEPVAEAEKPMAEAEEPMAEAEEPDEQPVAQRLPVVVQFSEEAEFMSAPSESGSTDAEPAVPAAPVAAGDEAGGTPDAKSWLGVSP